MKHRGPGLDRLRAVPRADAGARRCGSSSPIQRRRATSTSPRTCAAAGARSRRGCAPPAPRSVSIEEINEYTISATLALRRRAQAARRLHRVGAAAPRCCRSGTRSRSSRTSATRRRSAASTSSTTTSAAHGIGHVRMATESDVDISNAHPYWAYPFSDVAVVHNGQLTNYHQWRRRLERMGHRFASECDSEIIAVYLAQKMPGRRLARGRDAPEPRGPRRRVHLHLRHRGRARDGQGRARGQAARPLRGRGHGRARVRGDGDPRRASTTRSTPTTRTRAR